MQVEKKLEQLGLSLPDTPKPVANYVSSVLTGSMLFVSGQVGFNSDRTILNPGKLGKDLSVETGYETARQTVLGCLSVIKGAIGDLDNVKQVVKITVMINATSDFADQPQVANGASDLLVEVYGDKGRHARVAVGMSSLPLNASVEIDMVVEVDS